MSYVVIGYPNIDSTDLDWIQDIRQKHDFMQFTDVKPHVTFIFPTAKLDKGALINHVMSKLVALKHFKLNLIPRGL